MREIKFKFWLGHTNIMTHPHGITEICKIIPIFTNDITPLQYTGVKDSKDKEIYEGDICWTYEIGVGNTNRVVEFDDGSFVLSEPRMLQRGIRGWKSDYIKVIGNIYENPELIKPKN